MFSESLRDTNLSDIPLGENLFQGFTSRFLSPPVLVRSPTLFSSLQKVSCLSKKYLNKNHTGRK